MFALYSSKMHAPDLLIGLFEQLQNVQYYRTECEKNSELVNTG